MLVSVTVILPHTCEQSLRESPVFSPLVIIQLNFSRGSAGRSLRAGRALCYPANGTTNLFQGTQSTSLFSPLKPDSINSEQTPPRQHDYKIPVPLKSHLSVYLTSPFFSLTTWSFPTPLRCGLEPFTLFTSSLFGSINLGKWNRCLLLSKAPHLLVLLYFFYRAEFSLSKCLLNNNWNFELLESTEPIWLQMY